MLGVLVDGTVRIFTDAGEVTIDIDGGFISVDHDRVTLVTETADLASRRPRPASPTCKTSSIPVEVVVAVLVVTALLLVGSCPVAGS